MNFRVRTVTAIMGDWASTFFLMASMGEFRKGSTAHNPPHSSPESLSRRRFKLPRSPPEP